MKAEKYLSRKWIVTKWMLILEGVAALVGVGGYLLEKPGATGFTIGMFAAAASTVAFYFSANVLQKKLTPPK